MNEIRSLHVIGGLARHFGGPSYSVPRLCEALSKTGANTKIISVQGRDEEALVSPSKDLRFRQDFAGIPMLRGMRISRAMREALGNEARRTDVVHDHGLWLAPNLYAGWTARSSGKPLVVSPRGMLSREALKFSSMKKRAFWKLLQGPALSDAACYHATSTSEYEDVLSFGIKAPVAIIPNGIDLLPLPTRSRNSASRAVLFLGRIHPIKGLDNLIEAWAIARKPGWQLWIVGGDESGYAAKLRGLTMERSLNDVFIKEPVMALEKLKLYRTADLFVLPSHSENFGVSVAEALAAETPVISTKGAPWRGLETNHCGWWIDHGVAPLAEALVSAMALPRSALEEMGVNGRAWMERDFSWDRVAQAMMDVYQWLVGGASRPETVRVGPYSI